MEGEEARPSNCPHCGSVNIRPWGQTTRNVHDASQIQVRTYRYSCERCHRTFRYYPRGIDRSIHSVRIRKLAALIWLMDLSCRDVAEVFQELGVNLNRMTIWREGVKMVDQLNEMNLLNQKRRICIDKEGDVDRRPKDGVVLVLSLAPGKFSVLGTLNINDPRAVVSWLQPIVKDLDIDVSVLGTTEFTRGTIQAAGQ
jgi:transposase